MRQKRNIFLISVIGLIVLAGSFYLMTLPKNHAFEHYADMGTSGTGMALARSYYHGHVRPFEQAPGYLLNGEMVVYGNWPPIGFMIFAQWLKWLGDDSIVFARLLCGLLFVLNTILFFFLLLRVKMEYSVAMITSILFTVLPFHLEFSKLIFSDIWLIPIWLLCCHLYLSGKVARIFIIPLVICGSISLMWFGVFIIPAFIISLFNGKRSFKIGGIISGIAVIILFQAIIFHFFSGNYMVDSLRRWTFFVDPDFGQIAIAMVRRSVTFLFESASLLLLIFSLSFVYGIRLSLHDLKLNKKLFELLQLISITLIFMSFSVPNWVVTHTYGVVFWDVLIALIFGLFLQLAFDRVWKEYAIYKFGGLLVTFSVLLYFLYPNLSEAYRNDSRRANQVVDYINHTYSDSVRACVFFNIPNIKNWSHAFEIGIKEQTNAYIFVSDSINDTIQLMSFIDEGLMRMKKSGRSDFDSSRVLFVTNDFYLKNELVLDSLVQGDLSTYQIDL